ncbi:unnamed protein product, partial [Didymodactylos carnosus]
IRKAYIELYSIEQVVDQIELLITQALGTPVNELARAPVKIYFVNVGILGLRGYSGINCVYVNEWYLNKIISDQLSLPSKPDSKLLSLITAIDLMTLTIHETAHQLNDPNMSTPTLFNNQGLTRPSIDNEFGRLAEKSIFGEQIDWFASIARVKLNFLEKFVYAIENSSKLPTLTANDKAIKRHSPSPCSAIDFFFHPVFF